MMKKIRYDIKMRLNPSEGILYVHAALQLPSEEVKKTMGFQVHAHIQMINLRFQNKEIDYLQYPNGRVVLHPPLKQIDKVIKVEFEYICCFRRDVENIGKNRVFIADDFFWLRDDQCWYPLLICPDREEDLFPVEPGEYVVELQMPIDWHAAASSPLKAQWIQDHVKYYLWDTQGIYLGMTIVGGILQQHREAGCSFLWFEPEPEIPPFVHEVIAYLEGKIGPYPHGTPLVIVIGPDFAPGAYADRGLIYLSKNKMNKFNIIHELVHQWWGRGIFVKYPRDRWLTEGLADYLAILYLTDNIPYEKLENYKQAYVQTVSTWGDRPICSVGNGDYQKKGLISALLYKKGTWLHRMLHYMFQEDYFVALKEILQDYTGKFVTTPQFFDQLGKRFKQVETIYEFMEAWFYSAGFPKLQLELMDLNQTPYYTEFTIRITQVAKLFSIPLDVEIHTSVGKVKRKIFLKSEETIIHDHVQGKMLEIVVDPDNWILKKVISKSKLISNKKYLLCKE